MAEVLTNIYDLLYPTPPALKDIAAIAVAAKLWRKRIIEYRLYSWNVNVSEDDIEKCYDSEISLRSELPHLPSTILPIVEGYFGNVRNSYDEKCLRDTQDFRDIVCDFDGTINYDRLAKLAILREDLYDVSKFKVACRHCFEDDIKRFWPSVSEYLNLDDIDFNNDPLLYYWICRLRNQLYKIPSSDYGYATIDGREIKILNITNWSSVEYFWNRLNVENRKETADFLLRYNGFIFCRYIFARLNEEELNALMTERRDDFLCTLLNSYFHYARSGVEIDGLCVLAVWKYIKHKVSHKDFICAVRQIIKNQTIGLGQIWMDRSFSYKLWSSTPDHLKQVVIQDVLPGRSLLMIDRYPSPRYDRYNWPRYDRYNWLILSVLTDASSEASSTFWNANWRAILPRTKTKDLQQFISLCCETESDIILFKKNNLSKYENIGQVCLEYLKLYRIDELNEFLNFCCWEKQTISVSKMKLLTDYEMFLREVDGVDIGEVSYFITTDIHPLSTFIDDVYNDTNLAADFKIRVLLAPRTTEILCRCVAEGNLQKPMLFIDVFAMSEQAAIDFKERHFMPALMNFLTTASKISCYFRFDKDEFKTFMQWCFGSEDKISAFKRTVPVDEIARHMKQQCEEFNVHHFDSDESYMQKHVMQLYSALVKFLEWFFSSPQEIAEFKKKFNPFAPIFEFEWK